MHFIGMLAVPLPFPVDYLVFPTLLSFLVCVLVVGIAVYATSAGPRTKTRLVLSSVLMGVGIFTMHDIGMSALDACTSALNDPRYVMVSTQGRGDEAALLAALSIDADYVAFVGSRHKTDALRKTLRERGIAPERLAGLKAPARLDVGAITPDEIAVSIVAEIVAVRRGKAHRGQPATADT